MGCCIVSVLRLSSISCGGCVLCGWRQLCTGESVHLDDPQIINSHVCVFCPAFVQEQYDSKLESWPIQTSPHVCRQLTAMKLWMIIAMACSLPWIAHSATETPTWGPSYSTGQLCQLDNPLVMSNVTADKPDSDIITNYAKHSRDKWFVIAWQFCRNDCCLRNLGKLLLSFWLSFWRTCTVILYGRVRGQMVVIHNSNLMKVPHSFLSESQWVSNVGLSDKPNVFRR